MGTLENGEDLDEMQHNAQWVTDLEPSGSVGRALDWVFNYC